MKYLLGLFLFFSLHTNAQWSNIANNQCVSFSDIINSNLFVTQNSPVSSNKLVSKYDAANYFFLDPTNAGFNAKTNNQLLSKQDLTSAAVSFNVSYGLSGDAYVGWSSSTDACNYGPSSTNVYVAHATSYSINSFFAINGFPFNSTAWYYTNTYSNAFHTSINANGYYYIDAIQSCNININLTVTFYVDDAGSYIVEANVIGSTLPNTNVTVVGNLSDPDIGIIATNYAITIDANTSNKKIIYGLSSGATHKNCGFVIQSFDPLSNNGQSYSWTAVNKY